MIVSDKHPLRTTIIGGTIALVLGTYLIEPVRRFFIGAWHVVIVVAGAVWSALTTSVPLWSLLVAAGIAAVIAAWARRRRARPPKKVYDPTTRTLRDPAPAAPVVIPLDALADAIIRQLAVADGAALGVGDLAEDLHTSRLRVEQALDRLAEIELVKEYRHVVDGPRYGLTSHGRDSAIAHGYI